MAEEQIHPRYKDDRLELDRLLTVDKYSNNDLLGMSRLVIRYSSFNGAKDIKADLERILIRWKLTTEELQQKTRSIWSSGFRPDSSQD